MDGKVFGNGEGESIDIYQITKTTPSDILNALKSK